LNKIPSNLPKINQNDNAIAKIKMTSPTSCNTTSKNVNNSKQTLTPQVLKKKNNLINRKTIRNYTAAAAASNINKNNQPINVSCHNTLVLEQPQTQAALGTSAVTNSFNFQSNSLLLLQPAQTIKADTIGSKYLIFINRILF